MSVRQLCKIIITSVLLSLLLSVYVFANGTTTNTKTGYIAVIEDPYNNMTIEEEKSIMEVMVLLTHYGNVAYIVTDDSHYDSAGYANACFDRLFGKGNVNGIVFLIDKEMVYILTDGAIERVISSRKAEIITDNVYTYAMQNDYYNCGYNAFLQMNQLLEGKNIPKPMEHICNALLALVIGFFFCYILIRQKKIKTLNSDSNILEGSKKLFRVKDHIATPNGKVKKEVNTNVSSGYYSSGVHHSSHHSVHHSSSHHSSHHSSHRSGGGHRR